LKSQEFANSWSFPRLCATAPWPWQASQRGGINRKRLPRPLLIYPLVRVSLTHKIQQFLSSHLLHQTRVSNSAYFYFLITLKNAITGMHYYRMLFSTTWAS
jgi:hypothetical protein